MDQRSNQIPDVTLGRTFGASMVVLVAGLGFLWMATAGGQSFTTETLRRQQVLAQPQRIDPFDVTTSTGEKTNLERLLAAGGKVWLVDFVYTRCQTVCSSLGSVYQQLQAQIETRGLQSRVGLLSISFDPANDDAAAVADYAKRMGMNPDIWQIVTLSNWQDRRNLLDAFGIMVVPAPLGEFEHNAALHVMTSDARLVRIMDYLEPRTALDAAVAINQSPAAVTPKSLLTRQ